MLRAIPAAALAGLAACIALGTSSAALAASPQPPAQVPAINEYVESAPTATGASTTEGTAKVSTKTQRAIARSGADEKALQAIAGSSGRGGSHPGATSGVKGARASSNPAGGTSSSYLVPAAVAAGVVLVVLLASGVLVVRKRRTT